MVKPKKEGAVLRRSVTISLYALTWLALTGLAPLWIPVACLIGVFRRRSFIGLRLLLFGWFYLGLELVALTTVALTYLRHRDHHERLKHSMLALQSWWAHLVMSVARRLLALEVVVEGAEAARPGPAILFVRHASIVDTLLPCVYLQRPGPWGVRYILKQELLFDPCLDVVGNILPNYFVDRAGDTAEELAAIRRLVEDLGTDGVLIFPEGTRFSSQKRRRSLARIEREQPELLPTARSLTHVLPPKPGGALALLEALPEVDCVFVAHSGLESFAKIADALSGDVVGSTVHILVWRVPAEDVPQEQEQRLLWLYAQWGRVSEFVATHREGR